MPQVTVLKAFRSKYDKAILKKTDEGKLCNLSDRDLDEISKRSGGPYVKIVKGSKVTYQRDAKTDKIIDDMEEIAPGVTSYKEEVRKLKKSDPR